MKVRKKVDVQFDLEQAIMQLWNCSDDFKMLAEVVQSKDFSKEHLIQTLIGFGHIYHLKGEKCFELFEEFLNQLKEEKNPPNFYDEQYVDARVHGADADI